MKTIGLLAKELSINVETIRFYERKGLIKQPAKPANGYRRYDSNTVSRIKFILKAKTLGFTLNEISSLLNLNNDCNEIKSIGLQKLAVIQQKIKDLQELEYAIKQLTDTCQTNPEPEPCPLINEINKS
jgi:MerR family transcriptional regulator, mercuric resistance operon regulatory protein